jgi:hypothetical protein
MAGSLPGSWVQPTDALTAKDRRDPFSLEGVLGLSVALGHVGAVDAQKEIIAHWVLPLMGLQESAAVMGHLLASPQIKPALNRRERLESFSGLLSHFDLPQ